MQEDREQLGFVGLGNMGRPMAQRLLQAARGDMGVRVFDQRAERMDLLVAQGAFRAPALEEVARPGGVVFTMVANDQELLQVALGDGGILHQLGKNGVHVSLSTVSPEVSAQLARLYRQQGSAYLAATVLGRPDVAEQGQLSIFLAGDPTAKTRVSPLLSSMGQWIYDLGEKVEAATIAKIALNFLIVSAIEAMGEAAALVEAYGLDRARFLHMLVESPLFKGVVYEQYGAAMIGPRDFSANWFPVERGLKDVALARRAGQRQGVALPYVNAPYEHLLAALAAGRGNEDWSVLSEFARPGALELVNVKRSGNEANVVTFTHEQEGGQVC
jgi:3-hydroxyisobutyrate dehydrogenase-like beta-hydroxyacid dehydrogenase